MISVKLAKNIGFCAGVRRAVDIVEKTLSANKGRIYSLGPVIHNLEVINHLEKKGLKVIDSLEKLSSPATVVLPSHGAAQRLFTLARKRKLKLIDATCPHVASVQKICGMLNRQGFRVIIVGNPAHPEIKALMELARSPYVIEKKKDIKENIFLGNKIGIISQTTQNKDVFFDIVSAFLQRNPLVKEVRIFNTICLDTIRRQEEVKKLAKTVGALLVIGSSLSANTKRLFCIGSEHNKNTYLVESESALINKMPRNVKKIGVISGASTPDWLVKKIIKKIHRGGI